MLLKKFKKQRILGQEFHKNHPTALVRERTAWKTRLSTDAELVKANVKRICSITVINYNLYVINITGRYFLTSIEITPHFLFGVNVKPRFIQNWRNFTCNAVALKTWIHC